MPQRLRTKDSDFEQGFTKLLHSKRESSPQVHQVVADILTDVRLDGDDALIELTRKFDRVDLRAESLRITGDEIEAALKQVEPEVLQALEFASQRIKSHHEKQKPEDHIYTDELGVKLGTRWTPVDAVGIYVPGGLASYPSSVLMNAIPAKVAGVARIAMVVPTPDGKLNPAVLAAARIAGVSEIYRIGGAQGVGALAYGTKTIAPVDKIVGPGNAYVAEAKRQVFGTVGIDMIAGPSEILVIADDSANPAWIAADLLAQAEHGAGAQSIAMVTSEALGDEVAGEVERQLKTLSRNAVAAAGWDEFGAIIVVENIARAVALSNRLAPEHLELALDNPEKVLPEIRHAGSIFMGHHTPEAVGDYVAGPNHVLPTARSARYASALGTIDFMKRSSILNCSPGALARLARETVTLAEAEDLQAHGRSLSIRLNS